MTQVKTVDSKATHSDHSEYNVILFNTVACGSSVQKCSFLVEVKFTSFLGGGNSAQTECLFFSLLTLNSTNENHAASWYRGNVALFAFIFPREINVYATIIWPGSCDSDYCVCFSRHHGTGLRIAFVMGALEMLSGSAVCVASRCFYFSWTALTSDVRINQVSRILSSLTHYK